MYVLYVSDFSDDAFRVLFKVMRLVLELTGP